jgi:cyclic pyranopterin phosphate synthase
MLTHIDEKNQPQMVDVSSKNETVRRASACGIVRIGKEIMNELTNGDIQTKKGPVFTTAIIAGTMAVKKCHELIPFCHQLNLEKIHITILPVNEDCLEIRCHVTYFGKTGVEMEALTGVHVAALTIHDMCKAMSQDITIEKIRVIKKTGGKKDYEVKE